MSNWISIDKAKPIDGERVLIASKNGVVDLVLYDGGSATRKWVDIDSIEHPLTPVYWQPLPAAPMQSSFETWWLSNIWRDENGVLKWQDSKITLNAAFMIWDAAIKASNAPDFVA